MSFVYLQRNIQENWGKIAFLGGFYVLVGIMAIMFAGIATFASIAFLGLCLAIIGFAELYFAVQTRKEGRAWYHGFFGVLALICGGFMMGAPVQNALILTWTAAVYLLVRAIVQMVGSAVERYRYWGWSFADGLVAAFFAGTILYLWPFSSFWLIGLFVGVSLIFHGAEFLSLAALGRGLKKTERQDLYRSANPPPLKGEAKKRDPDIENFY